MAGGSAYLGGSLVYHHQIGVDHTAIIEPPEEFTPVLAELNLLEGQPTKVMADDVPVVLVRSRGQIYALVETCAHLGGPLAEGTLQDEGIVCPWHGSRFALADGRVLDGPATFPQPCFETRVREGQDSQLWLDAITNGFYVREI